jgi:hypothetical protein
MVKGRPWAPETLRQVGGTEGVGTAFLEEAFSSGQANPKHRLHQKAAQAVLKALLPETGTTIKGQLRSEQELQNASGYAARPRDFTELLHILDNELRLITPIDPDLSASKGQIPTGRYFQLTHDYLVHSLRNWLTRKQRETKRGRAELVLEDRYVLWKQERDKRYLPSLTETLSILLYIGLSPLQADERRMVKVATFHRLCHACYYVLLSLCIVVASGYLLVLFRMLGYVPMELDIAILAAVRFMEMCFIFVCSAGLFLFVIAIPLYGLFISYKYARTQSARGRRALKEGFPAVVEK